MNGVSLSVVIPAYNASATVARAALSAVRAGASEVIVVDDGSNDNTAELATNAGCRVIRQSNSGAATARRVGVDACKTSHVILLDSDDEVIAEGVRKSIELTKSLPDWGAISGRTVGVRRDGSRTVFHHWDVPVNAMTLLQNGFSPGPPASYVWNRDVLVEAMFGVMPAVWPRFAEDYELLLRVSLRSRIAYHDVPSAIHNLAGGKSFRNALESSVCAENIRRHYSELLGVTVRARSRDALESRALVRQAKAMGIEDDRRVWVSLVARSAMKDPLFAASLLWRATMRRAMGASQDGATSERSEV
jgi:glycosyltransferase involved in cell wall biosynthesis